MSTSFKSSFHRTFVSATIFLWLLPVAAVLSIPCQADQTLSFGSTSDQAVNWTSGPVNANLGTLLDIKIAKGYRFTDAAGAKNLLKRMNNPIPQGLVGILSPESGQWWAVLTYKNIGHVRVSDKDQIDAAAILKTILGRVERQNEDRAVHGLPSISSVHWKLPPVYDAKTHTVEWALEAKTQTSDVINRAMRLLGRQGVLEATVVEPYQNGSADMVPLKEVMKNVSFQPGQRYTDFQKGDTVADIGLTGLIAGTDDSLATKKSAVGVVAKSASGWSWAYVGAVGVFLGGGVLFLRRTVRRRRRKARRAVSASPVASGNGTSEQIARARAQAAVLSAPGASGNGQDAKPKDEYVKRPASVENNLHHRHGARRKKMFDYHRFYTDTVMKLSSGTYTEASATSGRANGNGRINGRSFGRSVASQPPTHGETNQVLVQAHLDLIASQKELIDEQKRLMVQQAKLIEEKSKLIAEKNQLFDRQTELFERDLL